MLDHGDHGIWSIQLQCNLNVSSMLFFCKEKFSLELWKPLGFYLEQGLSPCLSVMLANFHF